MSKKFSATPKLAYLVQQKQQTRNYSLSVAQSTYPSLNVGKSVVASGLGRFVDCPVLGGPTGAEAATLTFMFGGDDALPEDIKPMAMSMGTAFFNCGGFSAGLATKQINNYFSGICMLGTAEAMNLSIRVGLDPKTLAGVINASRTHNQKDSIFVALTSSTYCNVSWVGSLMAP